MLKLNFFVFFFFSCFFSSNAFCQTQLVTNGGFATDLSGWTTSGTVAYSNFFTNGCAAFSGGNGAVDGIISQTITPVNGATLSGTLNFARRANGGGVAQGLFEIIDNVTNMVVYSTVLVTNSTSGSFITTTFSITAPSTSLLVRFTDQTTSTTALDFYFNTISITQPAALPVQFLSFNVSESNQKVMLKWEVASQVNNKHFAIERSANGVAWQTLHTINGASNTTNLYTYHL